MDDAIETVITEGKFDPKKDKSYRFKTIFQRLANGTIRIVKTSLEPKEKDHGNG